jgi:hypothetical protein
MKQRVKRHAVTQPLDQSYRLIPLTQEQNAIVDFEDFEWLSQWNWCAQWYKSTRSFYAIRGETGADGKWTIVLMHRAILKCGPKEEGDHKNLNTLDNRKENLRKSTKSQNKANCKKYRCNSSGFKGVYASGSRWYSVIRKNRGLVRLGSFDTPEQAAHAYDEAAKKLHGEFARLNFQE